MTQTPTDLQLVEDIEIRTSDDSAKMDDELTCNRCDGVICDVEHGDSLGLLVRTALDHLLTCGGCQVKVVVTVALDIDTDAWTDEYGVEGAQAIRADVKMHAANALKHHYDNLGVLGDEWSPR